MRAEDMTAEDVYRMLYEVPPEVRHLCRWVMTKDDLKTLAVRLAPAQSPVATHIVGKPIQIVDSCDEVYLAYPAVVSGTGDESALYEPCTNPQCPAHRVGYGHGHRIEETPQ